jgi:protein-disulfide isomerase
MSYTDKFQSPNCPHCGMIHQTTCPRIKAIEYGANGVVTRIEFHPLFGPAQTAHTGTPSLSGDRG